jgi:hypothetical protein
VATFDGRLAIVFGKNWKEYPPKPLPRGWKLQLSEASIFGVHAAGLMLEKDRVDRVIFSGGQTAGPSWPSEATRMLEMMRNTYSNVAGQGIAETKSRDTHENAQMVKLFLKALGWEPKETHLVTISYHLPRAGDAFDRSGFTFTPHASEFLIEELGKELAPEMITAVREYRNSARFRNEVKMENISRIVQFFDPGGRIVYPLVRRYRS